jgi:hypothetical protein
MTNGLLYDAFRLDKNENGEKRISHLQVEVDKEYRYLNTAPYSIKTKNESAT